MELKIINEKGEAAGNHAASDALFAREYNEALVHQVVVAYQANARSGNRKQKDRAEVHHSTKKPWKQKGTGRARAGMTSSPLWRGGGKTFPNSPDENFSHKVNRKMYRAGIAAILSQLVREDRLSVVESIGVSAPKTRELLAKLKGMGMGTAHDNTVLIVTDEIDDNLYLAARNLANAAVIDAQHADPVSLVGYRKVIMTVAAIKHLEEALV
jgi:large subunit ribosomal protein L4